MKLQRYMLLDDPQYLEIQSNPYGDWCKSEDVARFEASHAELLAAAKDMLDWWDHKRPNESAQDYINRLRAAIAKAEGEGL